MGFGVEAGVVAEDCGVGRGGGGDVLAGCEDYLVVVEVVDVLLDL